MQKETRALESRAVRDVCLAASEVAGAAGGSEDQDALEAARRLRGALPWPRSCSLSLLSLMVVGDRPGYASRRSAQQSMHDWSAVPSRHVGYREGPGDDVRYEECVGANDGAGDVRVHGLFH